VKIDEEKEGGKMTSKREGKRELVRRGKGKEGR
jgi:hypothetical protein